MCAMSNDNRWPRHATDNLAENGVDLTLIRQILAVTPAQRLDYMASASRNMAATRRYAQSVAGTERREA